MLATAMKPSTPGRSNRRHAWAAWLALWLLLLQTATAAGLIERPMAPFASADGGIVICTEHGTQTLPGDGVPGQTPSHHSMPTCPCCLPFSAGAGGAILATPVLLAVPAWSAERQVLALISAPPPSDASSSPQQPRAPPLSV
jgi:hypothetical protein